MSRRAAGLWLAIVLFLTAAPALAQTPQDSTLDNLVHDPAYRTGKLGTLGRVIERGNGPIDMVLVSGFGVGASAFDGFMRRNSTRYHMLAVTLPGFDGTAGPPMPPAGTSYGDQTWTRAAAEAVARLIRERRLEHPVLVGHFINGTQVVARVAIEHPKVPGALVLLAATPRFEPVNPTPYWPKGLTVDKKIAMVDNGLAPRWFKTVTRTTWVANNFIAGDYSADSTRGTRFASLANASPLPVLIRYLCEYHASDVASDLQRLDQPLLMIQPSFNQAVRADSTRSYLTSFFDLPWHGVFADRPRAQTMAVEDAGILVMDDQAARVDQAIADFLARVGR